MEKVTILIEQFQRREANRKTQLEADRELFRETMVRLTNYLSDVSGRASRDEQNEMLVLERLLTSTDSKPPQGLGSLAPDQGVPRCPSSSAEKVLEEDYATKEKNDKHNDSKGDNKDNHNKDGNNEKPAAVTMSHHCSKTIKGDNKVTASVSPALAKKPMSKPELTRLLTPLYIRQLGLEQATSVLEDCLEIDLISNKAGSLKIDAIVEFCKKLQIPGQGTKDDIANRLKRRLEDMKEDRMVD